MNKIRSDTEQKGKRTVTVNVSSSKIKINSDHILQKNFITETTMDIFQ